MRNPSDLVWVDVFEHMFWMTYETYGVRFGESNNDAFNFDLKKGGFLTIFDSGTSTVYVPYSLWKDFIGAFKKFTGVKFS